MPKVGIERCCPPRSPSARHVVRRIQISAAVADWITEAVRESQGDEQKFHLASVTRQQQYLAVRAKFERAYEDRPLGGGRQAMGPQALERRLPASVDLDPIEARLSLAVAVSAGLATLRRSRCECGRARPACRW
jgi:hypothetical protein